MTSLRLVRDDFEDVAPAPGRKTREPGQVYQFDGAIAAGMTTYSYVLKSGDVVTITTPAALVTEEIHESVWDFCEAVDALARVSLGVVR